MYDLARADATVRMSAYPASAWPKFPPDDLKAYEVRREEADKDEEAYKAREERWGGILGAVIPGWRHRHFPDTSIFPCR